MSVTFMPAGNCQFCDANGLTGKTVYDCQCKDYPEHCGNPCRECGGKGQVEFPDYPFEMNVANGNAAALQKILRMPQDYSGSCAPSVILDGIEFIRALQGCGMLPLVKETTEEGGNGSLRIVHCGRTPEQVESYMVRLKEIAEEAQRRGVDVVWG